MSQFRNPEISHLEGELTFRHTQRQMVMDADFNESKIHRNADGTLGSGGSTTFAQNPAKYHSEMAEGHKKIATEHNDKNVRISHQEAQERHEGAHIAQKNAKHSSLSDRHVATTHSSMADRSTAKAMAMSQSKVSASAKEHASYHRGYDPDIARPDGGHGAHVFEFPSEKHQTKFLESVGGAPHPYGGHRAILSGDAAAEDEHLGWTKMVQHLEGEGKSKESAEKIAGAINAKKNG